MWHNEREKRIKKADWLKGIFISRANLFTVRHFSHWMRERKVWSHLNGLSFCMCVVSCHVIHLRAFLPSCKLNECLRLSQCSLIKTVRFLFLSLYSFFPFVKFVHQFLINRSHINRRSCETKWHIFMFLFIEKLKSGSNSKKMSAINNAHDLSIEWFVPTRFPKNNIIFLCQMEN